jgi:hypothetical protein
MRRFGFALVGAGAVVMLVALFALSRAITDSGDPAASPPAAPAPTNRPSGATAAPSLPSAPAPSPAPASSHVAAPSGAPAPHVAKPDPWNTIETSPGSGSSEGPPGTRFNKKNLQYGGPQLRAQIEANAQHLKNCIRDVAGTSGPTGDATLTFVLAMQGGKVVVEQTDVARDATTLENEPLLDCMAKAATAMKFEGLPRDADAISVTRLVKLDAGELVENKLVTFSYIH